MNKWINPTILWDWDDFGFALILRRQNRIANYKFAIDIQIGWFNLWTQFWRKPMTSKEWVEREMASEYGCDWLEQSLEALKNPDVREDLKKTLNKES